MFHFSKKYLTEIDSDQATESWMLKNAGTECSGKSKERSVGIALQD